MELTLGSAVLAIALLGSGPATHTAVMRDQPQPSPLREAIMRDSARLSHVLLQEDRRPQEAHDAHRRNWIQRHPSCFGAMVGFVGGFLIGFLPGDDAVFDDYTAAFNGAVLGGIGAATGAILGWAGSRD